MLVQKLLENLLCADEISSVRFRESCAEISLLFRAQLNGLLVIQSQNRNKASFFEGFPLYDDLASRHPTCRNSHGLILLFVSSFRYTLL